MNAGQRAMSIRIGRNRSAGMSRNRLNLFLRTIVMAIWALFAAGPVCAAGPSVTAVLSNSNAVVGQMVQLQIKVTGSSNVKSPNEITVDGLEIRYAGQSQLLEGHNFQFTYSFVFNYTILPLKAGTFKIPPQMVEAGGGALPTPAPTLHAPASGSGHTP